MENKIINLQVNDNINTTENSVKSLKAQLREAQNEVNVLSEKFGATSREAVQAAKQAAILKDRIGDAKALTDAFNPDAKFRALTTSLSGVTGAFAAVQGGMALFGKESDDVQKTLLKVQAAMALSQGIQSVGESVDSFKQLGAVIKSTSLVQGVLTAATAAYNFVNTAATTGLKLFRAALIGTGIGALIVGVGLLISNFDKIKTVILNLIPGLANVSKFIGGIVDSVTDFVGATSDASRALDKLKKDADSTLAVNKKFMQEHGDQVDEYTKKKIDAKNAYATAVKEDGANQNELAKKLNRELAAIEFLRGDEKRKILKDANDKAASERKANNKKDADDLIAQKKKDAEDLKAGIKAAQDTEIALRNELTQVIGDAQDKQSEFAMSASEAEERIVKDKYFRLLELAKQQNRSKEEIDVLQIQKENELNDIRNVAKEKQDAIDKTNKDKRDADEMAAEKAKFEQKKAIQDAGFNLASGAVNFLKEIGGKSKAIQKAAIIAENAIGIGKMIIANNAANIGALATPQAIATSGAAAVPVIAMNNITTALGVATTIAATAKALGAIGGGSAGGAGSVGGGGGAAGGGAMTPPSFNVVGASSTNQLAQTIGSKEQQPIRTYVVSSDVSTAQSLDRNIIQSASIG